METLVQNLIASGAFGKNASPSMVAAIVVFIMSAVVFLGVAFPFAGIVSWAERRVWARIQSRVGPNRVGPQGFLQWLADGVKHVCKEDIIPDESDAPLFKMAPYLVMLAFTLPWAVMPFSSSLDTGRPERRHPLYDVGHRAHGGRRADGGMGVE